jgi:hypothetical protein
VACEGAQTVLAGCCLPADAVWHPHSAASLLLNAQREFEITCDLSKTWEPGKGWGTTSQPRQAPCTTPADLFGVPRCYGTGHFAHPGSGKQHAYIMLQLLGPTLHDLVRCGKITRDNFLQVLLLLMSLRGCTCLVCASRPLTLCIARSMLMECCRRWSASTGAAG